MGAIANLKERKTQRKNKNKRNAHVQVSVSKFMSDSSIKKFQTQMSFFI